MSQKASSQSTQNKARDNAQACIDYLLKHPDFFTQHPSVLLHIDVPHDSGGAASLIEYQSILLREKNTQLTRKLNDLIGIARENEALMERVHRMTLKIMDAQDLPSLVNQVEGLLQEDFNADRVCILVFGETEPRLDNAAVKYLRSESPELTAFADFRREAKPLCGRLREEQLEVLYDTDAKAIQSAALMPLDDAGSIGALSLGSFEPDRFHPGMGTVFLKLMGQILGRSLAQHLTTPAKRRA